jgi:hypothetical protein
MHEWVDHTGELELHVRAGTREAVFAEASEALGEVLGDVDGGRLLERALSVQARDLAALLADWLAELVWLAECESLIVERLTAVHVDHRLVHRRPFPRRRLRRRSGRALKRFGDDDLTLLRRSQTSAMPRESGLPYRWGT